MTFLHNGRCHLPVADRDVAPRNCAIKYAPVARKTKHYAWSQFALTPNAALQATAHCRGCKPAYPARKLDGFTNPLAGPLLFVPSISSKENSRVKTQPGLLHNLKSDHVTITLLGSVPSSQSSRKKIPMPGSQIISRHREDHSNDLLNNREKQPGDCPASYFSKPPAAMPLPFLAGRSFDFMKF